MVKELLRSSTLNSYKQDDDDDDEEEDEDDEIIIQPNHAHTGLLQLHECNNINNWVVEEDDANVNDDDDVNDNDDDDNNDDDISFLEDAFSINCDDDVNADDFLSTLLLSPPPLLLSILFDIINNFIIN